MPKLPMNYQNTIIYKICCKDINITDTYVGHTTNFDKRKCQHKYSCNNENSKSFNYYVYQFIRNNGGWNNWSMIEIEKYSCNDAHEAEARERHWLETLGATLNTLIPARTPQEYYHENREILNEYQKEYYHENREQISEYQKKYRKANKEILSEKLKEHYQKNKDRINEKNKEKITCECGCELTKGNLTRHRKSKQHLKFFE